MDMFSIFQLEQTYSMQVFNALMFCLIVLLFWNHYIVKFESPISRKSELLLVFLFLIYAVTPTYTGDFWGYKPLIENYDYRIGTWHLEELYQNLLMLIGPNYLLFRIVVWGGAEALFIISCVRFNLNPFKALFLLFCLFVTKFVYGRVTLAVAVYFIGVSFFCVPIKNKKSLSTLIGLIIIILSLFFHRSIVGLLLLTPIIMIPLSKKSITLVILIIPLLTFLLRTLLVDYSFMLLDDEYAESMQSYSTTKSFGDTAVKTNLLFWWGCLPFFAAFIIVTYNIFKLKAKSLLSHSVVLLYRLVFGITIFSFCCFFVRPENPTLFYRFLFMTMIPLVIILSEMRKTRVVGRHKYILLAFIGLTPDLATFFFRVFIKFTPITGH